MESAERDKGDPSSLTRSTISGLLWMTGGRFLKVPVSLLVVAVLARLLSPADFGIVAIATILATFSNVLVDGSFGLLLIQRRELSSETIGASLLLSALLAALFALVVIAASPLLQRQFGFAQMQDVLFAIALMLPITAATTVSNALLQRSFRFGILTLNSLLAQIAYAIVAIAFAMSGAGIWSLVWGQLAQFATDAILGLRSVRKAYRVDFSVQAMRNALRLGGTFSLSKILNWTSAVVEQVVIGRLFGATELGLFSRASTIRATANHLIGTGGMRVLLSTFAKMQDDRQRMCGAFDRALSTSLAAASLLSAFVILNAELIVRILLGPDWTAAIPVLQILFAAFIARSGYIVAEAVPFALGLGRASAWRSLAQLGLVLGGALVGARFGFIGAVIGVTMAYWIYYLLCIALVRHLLGMRLVRIARIHLYGLLIAVPPLAAQIATVLIVSPGDDILLRALPAISFAIVAGLFLAAAPATLLTDDIVKLRSLAAKRLLAIPTASRLRAGR